MSYITIPWMSLLFFFLFNLEHEQMTSSVYKFLHFEGKTQVLLLS